MVQVYKKIKPQSNKIHTQYVSLKQAEGPLPALEEKTCNGFPEYFSNILKNSFSVF